MADTVLTELKIHEFDSLAQMSQHESEIGDNDLVLTLDDKPPADIDLSNITDAGCERVATLGMPSDRYINLTLGATGSTYTAPADGWFAINKAATGSQYINMTANSVTYSVIGTSGQVLRCSVPAKKGDTCIINYNAGGTTNFFRFIYAEGTKHLAS